MQPVKDEAAAAAPCQQQQRMSPRFVKLGWDLADCVTMLFPLCTALYLWTHSERRAAALDFFCFSVHAVVASMYHLGLHINHPTLTRYCYLGDIFMQNISTVACTWGFSGHSVAYTAFAISVEALILLYVMPIAPVEENDPHKNSLRIIIANVLSFSPLIAGAHWIHLANLIIFYCVGGYLYVKRPFGDASHSMLHAWLAYLVWVTHLCLSDERIFGDGDDAGQASAADAELLAGVIPVKMLF